MFSPRGYLQSNFCQSLKIQSLSCCFVFQSNQHVSGGAACSVAAYYGRQQSFASGFQVRYIGVEVEVEVEGVEAEVEVDERICRPLDKQRCRCRNRKIVTSRRALTR